jgi:pimeloyl-ACP methyl ester carboxylesterase
LAFENDKDGIGNVSVLTKTTKLETHPIVIMAHGNACDINSMLNFGKELAHKCKSHCILLEYPGYGCSFGTPTESSCIQAVTDLIHHLHTNMKIPINNMILFGQSIGSGIASSSYRKCVEQYKTSPAGLVLISPYLSIATLKNDLMPSSYLIPILERFDTKENIKYCDTGLLIFHGTDDKIIPINHGTELHKIATAPINKIEIMLGSGHNNLDFHRIIAKTNEFIDEIFPYFKFDNVTYINKMMWLPKGKININHNDNKPSTFAKIFSSSIEPCAATASKASECIIF